MSYIFFNIIICRIILSNIHIHTLFSDVSLYLSLSFSRAFFLPVHLSHYMCQGVLQKTYKLVAGFVEEHRSGTTNTIHMLFENCVTYNEYITKIHILFQIVLHIINITTTYTCCSKN